MSSIEDRVGRFEEIRRIVEEAAEPWKRREAMPNVGLPDHAEVYPTFPSSLGPFDHQYGGFVGLTVLGGQPGCGKSTWALTSAVESAHAGNLVVMFDAENGPGLTLKRLRRWYGVDMWRAQFAEIRGSNFIWAPMELATPFEFLSEVVHRSFEVDHTGIVVVLDSLQSVIDSIGTQDATEYQKIVFMLAWMDNLVRRTDGFVRFLALSEINTQGELKGGTKLRHRASMVVGLTEVEEEGNDGDTVVEIEVRKNRDGRHGSLGKFLLDWRHSRFIAWRGPGSGAS